MNIAQLVARLRILIDRAVLTRVRYKGKVRVLQITPREDSPFDDIEHIQEFGHASQAPAGAEVITASLGGNRGKTIALFVYDRRHLIVLSEGESAIYNMHGDKVHVKSDGTIGVVASTKVEIISPLTVCSGDLDVGGKITCDSTIESAGDQIAAGVSQINHPHGGVTPGSGNSGAPIPS